VTGQPTAFAAFMKLSTIFCVGMCALFACFSIVSIIAAFSFFLSSRFNFFNAFSNGDFNLMSPKLILFSFSSFRDFTTTSISCPIDNFLSASSPHILPICNNPHRHFLPSALRSTLTNAPWPSFIFSISHDNLIPVFISKSLGNLLIFSCSPLFAGAFIFLISSFLTGCAISNPILFSPGFFASSMMDFILTLTLSPGFTFVRSIPVLICINQLLHVSPISTKAHSLSFIFVIFPSTISSTFKLFSASSFTILSDIHLSETLVTLTFTVSPFFNSSIFLIFEIWSNHRTGLLPSFVSFIFTP